MKERHTGIIIGAVLISVLSVGALTYFGLPYVYPYLNVPEKEQTGVLQTVFREFDSKVILHDNIFTYSAINDTNVQITTNGKSQIFVEFHTPCVLTLDPTFTGTIMFVFMLVVEGLGNRSNFIGYTDEAPASSFERQITQDVTINFMSDVLDARTYTISVQWKTMWGAPGDNYIKLYSDWVFVNRTLSVQEVRNP